MAIGEFSKLFNSDPTISGTIEKELQAKYFFQKCKLNDWFVSLARATSYELGVEACQAYAHQLIKEDDIVKGKKFH
jgi:hypothetical protein